MYVPGLNDEKLRLTRPDRVLRAWRLHHTLWSGILSLQRKVLSIRSLQVPIPFSL